MCEKIENCNSKSFISRNIFEVHRITTAYRGSLAADLTVPGQNCLYS